VLTRVETKDILPLIGVLIGWLLKELSDTLRHKSQQRVELGSALVGLMQLDAELSRLSTFLEFHKNRDISWEEYEKIRRETAERYLKRTDPVKAVESAVIQLARHDPTQASSLKDIPQLLTAFHQIGLQPISANTADYIKWLSTLEVIVQMSETVLKKLILRLAWLHGPLTWCRVKLQWRRQRSSLAKKNRQFTEQLISSLYAKKAEHSKPKHANNGAVEQ